MELRKAPDIRFVAVLISWRPWVFVLIGCARGRSLRYAIRMTSSFSLRDLTIPVGGAVCEQLAIPLEPYRQGGFAYGSSGGFVDARLDVSAMTTGWSLRLRTVVELHGPCSRCLEDATLHFDIDAREIHDEGAEDPELHCDFIDGDEQLDLSAWVQDAVGLEFPTRVLCHDDCQGLCPSCGVNRNDQSCECTTEQSDSRWDKLRELKLDD